MNVAQTAFRPRSHGAVIPLTADFRARNDERANISPGALVSEINTAVPPPEVRHRGDVMFPRNRTNIAKPEKTRKF